MATSLGSLVVSLGLNAAEFVAGLGKSEYAAKKFGKDLQKQFDQVEKDAKKIAVGFAVIGAAAAASFVAVDQLAKQAGNFKDLEEVTGGNAEAFASLAVAAAVGGVEMSALATTSVKLTKGLASVDDESKSAGAALEALGLNIQEFKALDPVAQMEALAKALAGFDDGAGKTAVLEGLVKGGAQLLPFLKELEAAGGRQVILTQQQIELADEYADKQARLSAELNLYAQAAATQVLPAITNLTGAAKDFIGEMIGIDRASKQLRDSSALVDFANEAVRALAFIADSADSIGRIFRITGNVIGATVAQIGALADGDLKRYNAIQADASATIDGIIAKQTLRFRLEKNIADQAKSASLRSVEDRGFTPPGKKLNFSGADKPDKAGKERESDAARYVEQLEKQLQATLDLNVVEEARVKIYDLQRTAAGGVSAADEKRILDLAQQLQFAKDLKKATEDRAKADEEYARFSEQLAASNARAIQGATREAEAIEDGNEKLREQITVMIGGVEAHKAIEDARLSSAIATKQATLASLEGTDVTKAETDAIRRQIEALEARRGLVKGLDVAQEVAKQAQAVKELQSTIFDIGANALSDFILNGGKASDVLKRLEKDVLAFLTSEALRGLKNSLTGSPDTGNDIFSMIAKIGLSFLGASSGGGVPGVGFSGGGFGEHFAAGGVSRGGMAMVGEQGPELVNLPRGARVFNHGDTKKMLGGGPNITVNYHAPQGQTRAAAMDAAATIGGGINRQLGRR